MRAVTLVEGGEEGHPGWRYLFCTNIWGLFARPVTPGAMFHAQLVTPGAKICGCKQSPGFVWQATPPHGGWSSTHLIWNNWKMIKATMLGIFAKGPWYSTFITAKYEYSSYSKQFLWKIKVWGKVRSHIDTIDNRVIRNWGIQT